MNDILNNKIIKKALKERKKRGGCGMWKNVGIPYMYKHYRDKLTEEEINWYENKIKGERDE